MINVYEQVNHNKIKSAIVIAGFFIFVIGAAWLISQALGWGIEAILVAFAFASVSTIVSYYQGDKIALSLSGARPVSRLQEPNLYSLVENLARAAQIPTPKIYISEDQAMNAFATGRDPKNASICLTRGLVNNLTRTELEGVVGHEIGHIKNLDTRLFAIVALLIGMIAMLSRLAFRSGFGDQDQDQNKNPLFFLGIVAVLLSPLIGQLIQLAISRRREFLADSYSAFLTRQPNGLIGALKKLSQNDKPFRFANNATAHFFIVNPFSVRNKLKGLATLFNTHPPIEDRIAQLEKMI